MLSVDRLCVVLLLVATPAAAVDRPFPMDVVVDSDLEGVLELIPRRDEIGALMAHESLELRGVELPGGIVLALDLERIDFDFDRVGVHVDGAFRSQGASAPDLSLWKGSVKGAAESSVWLALSSYGCYGWIQSDGRMWHLSSFVVTGTDWSASRARWIDNKVLDEPEFRCFADRVQAFEDEGPALPAGEYAGLTLECAMAIETDWQYFEHWGSLIAAETYLLALIGAVSDRYLEQINVVLTYPYVGLYTTPNDPWTTQDTGGSAGALLGEFRMAWANAIPAGAHIAHFLSGSYGGGVAFLDVLCDSTYGFGVSGGISGGVSFPVQQGMGNENFFLFAHETGHQFGSVHTFQYIPPIDTCPTVCISNGTLMSYCMLCPGGSQNITTYFHPRVVDRLRLGALSSCLPTVCEEDPFEGNDSCATAVGLAPGFTPGLHCLLGRSDHYRMVIADGGGLRVRVSFDHAEGNLDARLFDASCGQELTASTSMTDEETIVFDNDTGQAVAVVLKIEIVDDQCNEYTLDYLRLGADPCNLAPDGFEENDACSSATPVPVGVHVGLEVSATDPDFYAHTVEDGAWLFADASLSSEIGNVDLYLYAAPDCGGGPGVALASAATDADLEQIAWRNMTGAAADVVLEVLIREDGFSECNTYALSIDLGLPDNLGMTYCSPAEPSSTGFPARIRATGSAVLGDNDMTLTASVLPHGQFGYFLGSHTSAFVASPGGSQGNLCLGGQVARFVSQTQCSGTSGSFAIAVDLTAIPTTPPIAVNVGETWYFQSWFRDVNPVPTSNFTDGVSTTFLF
ncbi:MAG: hypothetical protein GY711_31790 [bacterium]|nr:hypothetical protein [bacterium]